MLDFLITTAYEGEVFSCGTKQQ